VTAPQLQIVVPCYNEEDVLPETISRLTGLLDQLATSGAVAPSSAVTFVDDGSRDATWRLIEEAGHKDPRLHGVKLAHNQGHQNALLAGLLTAPGDVVVSMDADLQDDLTAIPEMLLAHLRGAEIVYGVRASRSRDGIFKRYSAWTYYWLLRQLGVKIVPDHADFRLMSRKAITALAAFGEVNLFLRGIVPLLGFHTEIVRYHRQERFAGETKYPLGRMIALATNGVFSFSTVPLQWISMLGFAGALGSTFALIWAVWIRVVSNKALPGWASTVIPMYFLGSVQLLALGIIGGYVSRIYSETKRRPRYIIEKTTW
jgi:glycosyltransferase involved in cell wall biosynthesis